jgi:hypothetical protein
MALVYLARRISSGLSRRIRTKILRQAAQTRKAHAVAQKGIHHHAAHMLLPETKLDRALAQSHAEAAPLSNQIRDAVVFSSGTNFAAATVAYLQGAPDGAFGAPVINTLGGSFLGATAIDLNKDSRPDLVVSTQLNSPLTYRLHILINQGNGSFIVNSSNQPSTCASPVAGDFNRDGNNDIVCSDSERSLNVYAGNGDGTLRPPLNVPVGLRVREMSAGDINGDGNLDLAAAGLSGAGFVAVLLGNGALGFPSQNRYAGSYTGEGLRLMDFDADGRLDVVQAVAEANALAFQRTFQITVHFGRGDGTLDSAPLLRIPSGARAARLPPISMATESPTLLIWAATESSIFMQAAPAEAMRR